METMTDRQFEAAVSTITDRLLSEMTRSARNGGFASPNALGVHVRISDTRNRLRCRLWTAARSTSYDDIRACL